MILVNFFLARMIVKSFAVDYPPALAAGQIVVINNDTFIMNSVIYNFTEFDHIGSEYEIDVVLATPKESEFLPDSSVIENVRKALTMAEAADCPIQLKHKELRQLFTEIDWLRSCLGSWRKVA